MPPYKMSNELTMMFAEVARPMDSNQKRLLLEALAIFAAEVELHVTAALQESLRQQWSATLQVMLGMSKN